MFRKLHRFRLDFWGGVQEPRFGVGCVSILFSTKRVCNNDGFCFKRAIKKPDHFRLVFTQKQIMVSTTILDD